MNRIVCNTIDYVFAEDIIQMGIIDVVLKYGCDWKNLPVKEKPTYTSSLLQEDAGPHREQSVTAITKYDTDVELKRRIAFGVVLRMKTDKRTFYVGTDSYPCMTEVTSDMITDTFTFTAKLII